MSFNGLRITIPVGKFLRTDCGCYGINSKLETRRDAAKFEVCGHKFVDYSEYGYGVTLLNDW